MNQKRLRIVKKADQRKGPACYWMSRDQRVADNWALLYAQELAIASKEPLIVVFCLVPAFLGATLRQYNFMLTGLQEVSADLRAKNITFSLLCGSPAAEISKFVKQKSIAVLVTDFDPLRIKRGWKQELAKNLRIPFYEVDAHNVVPCWEASLKREFGAYTLRPKISRRLSEFLDDFPKLKKHPFAMKGKIKALDWKKAAKFLSVDKSVGKVSSPLPGERSAGKVLTSFIKEKLSVYSEQRNDPTRTATSGLSPYLHFGQLAAQRAALEVLKSRGKESSKQAFLEELIVRRELADNFCFYNEQYDSFEGFPDWAKKTLKNHARDKREYVYTTEELEHAHTHDKLWNAAQMQMVKTGKMHGYMRMYWAKKILEWTKNPEDALKTAIYLNDKYELDGRDPNGYVGIAWSIGGVHDRAWGERPIFGKIRYMSYNGCKSKFDVALYIAKSINL